VLELIFKVISLGFFYNHISNENAYLRNSWNVLDILVVTVKKNKKKVNPSYLFFNDVENKKKIKNFYSSILKRHLLLITVE
jgi:hypothetical protein